MPEVPEDMLSEFVDSLAEPTAPEVEVEQSVEPTPVDDAPSIDPGTTEADAEDSFRGIDPALLSVLDPQLQAALEAERKSIQAEATRKFQEAAKLRDQFEGIDLDLARNAVTYMERLAEPEFLEAAAEAMQTELERLGLSKAEAKQATEQAIEEQLADDDDYELEGSVNPQIQSEIQELKAWKAQQEAREAEREQAERLSYLANEALKQETLIRRDNPEWGDEEITDVIKLAHTHKGNLLAAAEDYRQQEARFAAKLLRQKSSIPNAMSPPPSSGSSAEPRKSWTLEEGHAAAKEALANMLANS